MDRPDIYIETTVSQSPKGVNSVCGDVVKVHRSPAGTLTVLCDGLGSGIAAALAAEMAAVRMVDLVAGGFTAQRAFARVAATVQAARGVSSTYAAMTAVFVRPDGAATLLSYEAPPPLWIARNRTVTRPILRSEKIGQAVIEQGSCFLAPGEALLIVSDGITQAGLGRDYPHGLPPQRIAEVLEMRLRENPDLPALADVVHRLALRQWQAAGADGGDDCTVAILACRATRTLNIMTGPPADRRMDMEMVHAFLNAPGRRAVCGGTTAGILGRCTGREVRPLDEDVRTAATAYTPPRFAIDGIDLVAEGAVTLTQTLNVLDLHDRRGEATSAISRMLELLYEADRVNFFVGRAENAAAGDVLMRQLGVRQRLTVVQRLTEELQKMNKLVTVRFF